MAALPEAGKDSASNGAADDASEVGQVIRVCGASGCEKPGTKLCTRCQSEAYCSAECQRRAWKAHKAVCKPASSRPESEAVEFLRANRLYSAQVKIEQLQAAAGPAAPSKTLEALRSDLDEKIKTGIYSEIVEERIALERVEHGLGYVASRDLEAGQAVLFDTAFVAAPVDGKHEYHFLIAEKAIRKGKNPARKTSARADREADFYHDVVKNLELKHGIDRKFLEDGSTLDPEQLEQMILCATAEGNCLYCTEAPDHVALFVAAARFNHSCSPNAGLESTKSTCLVRAEQTILKGTELTISYLPRQLLDLSGEKRRERLQHGRGFDCTCARCSAEESIPPTPQ